MHAHINAVANWWQEKERFHACLTAPALMVKLARAQATFDTLTAEAGELLAVEFTCAAEVPERLQVQIQALRTIGPAFFYGNGMRLEIEGERDITHLFSLEELEQFAEQLRRRAETGEHEG